MISFLSDDMGKKIALAKKASYFAYYVQAVSTVQKNYWVTVSAEQSATPTNKIKVCMSPSPALLQQKQQWGQNGVKLSIIQNFVLE